MNIPRLQRLLEIVESNKESMDMESWTTCPLGFACRDKEFIKQGLCFSIVWGNETPYFSGWFSYEAGAVFFNITIQESLRLFSTIRCANVDSCLNELVRLINSEQQPCGAD